MTHKRQGMLVAVLGMLCVVVPVRAGTDETAGHISHYENELHRNPNDSRARQQLAVLYHNRAAEYSQRGQWQEAMADVERALSLDPQEKVILNTASVIYNNYALQQQAQGDLLTALKFLKQAHDYRPDESQVNINLAQVYLALAQEKYEKAQYDSCRQFLRNAREFDPKNAQIYALAGELAYQHDEYEQAAENWNKALTLDPSLTAIRDRLDKLLQDQKLENGFHVRDIGNFKLKFEGREPPELAGEVSDILPMVFRDVGQDLELFPDTLIPVIIYPAQSARPDYVPDWAAGTYDGKIRVRADVRGSMMLKAVLYHEYTHALVFQLAGTQVPLWLNEGLAEYEAQRFLHVNQRKARRKLLLQALRDKTLFSIGEQLSGAERKFFDELPREKIELAYAQSESFVTFLVRQHSLYNLRQVLVRLSEGDSPRKAIEDVLFNDLDSLEQAWLKALAASSEDN